MSDKFDDLFKEWIEDLRGLSSDWRGDFKDSVEDYVGSVMSYSFDPKKFMDFLRKSGVDFTGLLGALSGQGQQQAQIDPYWILGLDRSASDEEVKKRYNELVQRLHPDKSGTEGTSRFFQMVQAAFEAIKRERGLK